MASNPMQRKARNSFLLGVFITLVITMLIGAAFYFVVLKPKQTEEQVEEKVTAYVLSQDVKSGRIVTADMLKPIEVYKSMIPNNYIDFITFSSMNLQDKEGHILYTNSDSENYIILKNANGYKLTSSSNGNNSNKQVLIKKDENGYYKTREDDEREYIEFLNTPFIAKVNLSANSILTTDLIVKNKVLANDVRITEYNMLELPTTVQEGDFVDIRLTLPNGQNFIVLPKQEIKSILDTTLRFEMTEDEILIMNSAIVEAYIITGSKFYVSQYIEPGIQEEAIPTYTPTNEVRQIINGDPNIVQEARNRLSELFNNEANSNLRTWVDRAREPFTDTEQSNVQQGVSQEIEKARQAREKYLAGLSSTTTITTEMENEV